MPPRVRGWLASPRLPIVVALVAAALVLPSLAGGMATEDFVLRDLAARPGVTPFDLYSILTSEAAVKRGQESGVLPWLAAPELRFSFFRPLAAAWTLFDFRVLADAVWLMHLENVALYAALAALVVMFTRRVTDAPWLGGLAGVLFAIDDAHGHASGWLANRSALLSATFGVAALYCHDRARRDGARLHAGLVPLLLGAALASGELGLGAFAYLLSYGLFLDDRPRALRALVPATSVALGWALLYRRLGHGASGSGVYLSPLTEPLGFVSELPTRLGALLLGQLGYPPADAWVALGEGWHLWLAAGGIGLSVLVVFCARSAAGAMTRPLGFGLAGMLLSLLPAAATSPTDRTLFLAGVGAAILLATLLGQASARGGWAVRLVALPLALTHLLAAPLLLPWRSLTMARIHELSLEASSSAYATVATGDDLVIALTAPDYYLCSQLRSLRQHAGRGPAPAVLCLAASREPVELAHVDANALSLGVPAGYLREPFNRIYTRRARGWRVGDRVYLGSMEALVDEVSAQGEPVRVTFRFIWPLSSERLRFVRWNGARFVPATPPKPGEPRMLSATE